MLVVQAYRMHLKLLLNKLATWSLKKLVNSLESHVLLQCWMTITSYSTAQIQVHFRLHCCTSDCYIHNISYSYSWSIYNNLLSDCFHAYISLQKHHSCFNHIWSSQLQFVVMGCIRYTCHWDTELTAANKSLVDKSIVTLTVPQWCTCY